MEKKRILCGAMAAAMTVSLAACSKGQTDAAPVTSTAAAETETTTAANAAANSTYTGTVTAVSAALLTLSTESDGDITVPLTDATTYTRGGMGGGQAPDGNPPEQPSGDSGDSQNGGTPPELPADGAGQGSAPADGQAPDASGQQPQGGAPDAKPADDGQGTDGTDSPDGSQSADAPEKPDGTAPDGQPGGEAEALSYESISVGDTVTVTVGDDGSAATVELAGGMGGPGGSLTANNGGMFYTTNTESTFLLDGVDITPSAENDFFLKCTGNANARGWGQSGANGADCSFTARNQTMEGDVIWDSISQLDFYMLDGSTLTGAVLDDETNAGSGGDGCANLYISADSTWVVTGNSVLTNLYSAGTIVDAQGRAVTIVDTNGTVLVQGTSDCTVTVPGYSTTVDASGASVSDSFSKYAVAKS